MSDLIFATEKTVSSGKRVKFQNNKLKIITNNQQINIHKGREEIAGKRARAHLARKSKQRHPVDNYNCYCSNLYKFCTSIKKGLLKK